MAKVEIDEEKLELLSRAYSLLDSLASDPKVSPHFEQLVKYKHPQVKTTRETIEPHMQEFADFKKKAEERWKKEDEGRVENHLNSDFDRLRKDYGYTDDGIEKIKKLMVDRNIPDVDAAAALFDRQNPAPEIQPSGLSPTRWRNAGTEDDNKFFQDLMDDPDGAAEKMAIKVYNEVSQKDRR